MTDNHPITPPPALVENWIAQIWHEGTPVRVAASDLHVATRAAQWGADQELDACCEWLTLTQGQWELAANLRAARRPNPPSLSRVALLQLDVLSADLGMNGAPVDLSQIRRALERLQQLEEQQ
jgi:hypothetical protein